MSARRSSLRQSKAINGHHLSRRRRRNRREQRDRLKWRPSRAKFKSDERDDYLELAFLTPELGLRERRTMQAMADATGHRLRIRPNMKTFDLIEIARKLAPKEWRLLKQPSLHSYQGLAPIKAQIHG